MNRRRVSILVCVLALLLAVTSNTSAAPRIALLTGRVKLPGYATWPAAAGSVMLTDCATGRTVTIRPVGNTFTVPWPVGKCSISLRASNTLAVVRAVKVTGKGTTVDFGTLKPGDIDRDNYISGLDTWAIITAIRDGKPCPNCDVTYDGYVRADDVFVTMRAWHTRGESCFQRHSAPRKLDHRG